MSPEPRQSADTRTFLFEEIEKNLKGRMLITFFTSFSQGGEIDDADCDMLQSLLQHGNLSKGLVLMINSPGGYPYQQSA